MKTKEREHEVGEIENNILEEGKRKRRTKTMKDNRWKGKRASQATRARNAKEDVQEVKNKEETEEAAKTAYRKTVT